VQDLRAFISPHMQSQQHLRFRNTSTEYRNANAIPPKQKQTTKKHHPKQTLLAEEQDGTFYFTYCIEFVLGG
jgi:hypothetical protein